MYQIRTIQRDGRGRSGYSPVVDLRIKTNKTEPVLAQPIRIQEKQSIRPPVLRDLSACRAQAEEKPQNDFVRNFSGILPRAVATLLVGFFVLNPFLDVYADELPLIPIQAATESATASTPSELAAATSSPENIIPPIDTALSTTTENIIPILSEASTTEAVAVPAPIEDNNSSSSISYTPASASVETIAPIDPPAATTTEVVIPPTEVATTTEPVASTSPESIEASSDVSDAPVVVENTLVPDVPIPVPEQVKKDEPVVPEPPKTEAPRQAEKVETTASTTIVNVIERKYLFRENECTRLDDGAFYCLPPETASTTSISSISLPRVFAERDVKNGGNKEIYFEDANGKVRITNNDYDDDAPAYDKNSNLIVWHALIKGRMQIMLYDRNSNTAKQLTDTPYNNTDPKIHGKSIVWQGWVNNNWEIFYIKDAAAEPPAMVQITMNEQPDMFPIISDGFITWQSFFGGSWRVFVYNLDNGQTSQISQPEAGKYENPRFALLFENRKENGEVETVGYDVVSGKEIPINAPHVPPPAASSPAGEEDKAVPVPAGQTGTGTTSPMKNPGGKDDEGEG